MYRLVVVLSPGVFVQRYFQHPEGVDLPEERQQQLDFWRKYSKAHWQEVIVFSPEAETDDIAMMNAIGELLIEDPDHRRFRRALSVWMGRSMHWRLNLRESLSSWRSFVATERQLMDREINEMRWIKMQMPGDYSARQFRDVECAYLQFGEMLDVVTADTRPDFAARLMSIAREVASTFNGAWLYVISKEPTIASPPVQDIRFTQGRLPVDTGIAKRPSPQPQESGSTQEPARSENAFRRVGDVWHVSFKGKSTTVRHSVGMGYIAELVSSQDRLIDCTTLAGVADIDHSTPTSLGRDPARINEIQIKIADLTDEIEEQQRNGSTSNVLDEKIELRAQLKEVLAAEFDSFSNDPGVAKTCYKSVQQATLRARKTLSRTEHGMADLSAHLLSSLHWNSHERTVIYRPTDDIDWEL